jgi:hypothetical protein
MTLTSAKASEEKSELTKKPTYPESAENYSGNLDQIALHSLSGIGGVGRKFQLTSFRQMAWLRRYR